MAELTINSFKYGLDTRKDILTSQPGTLVTCENGHINPGGEVEKRKAFVRFADYNIPDDGAGDQGLFGIEATDAGLVAFGSALNFGATVTQGQPRLSAAAPTGITYQQLMHPSLFNDSSITYSRSIHRIISIPFSENYNGKAFVCAKFIDGNYFLYYDGDLIQQSANGLVLTGRTTLADLADDLARQLNAIGWIATANVSDDETTVENGSVIVKSPQSDYFSALPEYTSTSGLIGIKQIASDGASTAGTRAVASFRITVNTGPFNLSAPANIDGTGATDLCGGNIAAAGSASLTAAAIIKAVNDLTYIHGYLAATGTGLDTDVVYVYAPLNFDISTPIDLTVTGATTAAPGASNPELTGAIVPNPLNVVNSIRYNDIGRRTSVAGQAVASGSGGTGSYDYGWEAQTPTSSGGIKLLTNPLNPGMTFLFEVDPASIPLPGGGRTQYSVVADGQFVCKISSGGVQISIGLHVTLTLVVNY